MKTNPSNLEIEYKFFNINVEEITKKLEELKAEFIFDTIYKIYNHDKEEWRAFQGRVRLREGNGKTTMAYKAEDESGFDSEIEFEISDIEKAHELMLAIGVPVKRTEEKRRIRYMLNNVEIDIDFWPGIEPYLEIEAETKDQIVEIAEKLDLEMKSAVKLNAAQVYKKLTGKDVPDEWVFEKSKFKS